MLSVLFLFESADKMSSVEYIYASGIILALLVFGATYFHRQVGLVTLLFVGLICFQSVEATGAVQSYVDNWNFSCRLTFALSVILFFAAIILKRKLKARKKAAENL